MMKRRPMLATALATATLTLCSACYGSFLLTQKVYELNGELIQDKFGQSALFWAFSILPVYGIAVTVDALILNLIEFWTGSNPMADVEIDVSSLELPDGRTLQMTLLDKGQTLRVCEVLGETESNVRYFSAPDHRGISQVTDEAGALVATAHMEGGALVVAAQGGELMALSDADEVGRSAELVSRLRQGEAALALR